MKREEWHTTKRTLDLNVEGCKGRVRPKKRFMDWVRKVKVLRRRLIGESGRKIHILPTPSNEE